MLERLMRPVAAVSFITLAVCGIALADGIYAQQESSDGSEQHARAIDAARRHVETNLEALGLAPGDVVELTVSDVYVTRATGLTHVYLQQRHAGIAVHNGLINLNVLAGGDVLHVGSRAVAGLDRRQLAVEPRVAPLQAVEAAARASGLHIDEPIRMLEQSAGASRNTVFSRAGIALEPMKSKLVYFADANDRLRLAWRVEIYERSAQHYWLSFVDAASGEVIEQRDQVVHDRWDKAHEGDGTARQHAPAPARVERPVRASTDDGSGYRVFEVPKGNPDDGPRTLVGEPAHAPASPFGWHDTDGVEGAEFTITRGNNVHAYQDRNASNSSSGDEPDGGPELAFDFPLDPGDDPVEYVDAAVTNLFYWNNLHHDLSYVRGFDEAAGNFQVSNYGNGGAGNDPVRAEAQDGEGVNNANFMTPSDGSAPRMQMFTWDLTTPGRDGDLDAGIILHEYAHGISNRQTGGPSQAFCLSNAEQAGEGWSDWHTLVYTAKSGQSAATNRGVGTYVLGEAADGAGIRAYPYNTDMNTDPRTYADTQGASVPHGVGSIWTAMLWEVYWNLVDEYGFNPDFYADWDQGGNLLAMQLVNDGLKLQPCSPGFVDARDAILAADQALTGGANQCLIWEGFAKRGLGFSASQGSSDSNSDNSEAFDMPAACDFGQVSPPVQAACAGDPIDFEISLGSVWTAAVDLSVSGHPGTAVFSENPVNSPGTSTLTFDDTGGAAAGGYNPVVEATDGSEIEQFPLALEIFDQSPAGTSLDAPSDGAGNVAFRPVLDWTPAAGSVSYLVEVATDDAFDNVVYSAQVEGSSHELASALAAGTTHYWRVQAINPCGTAPVASVFSFTTAETSLVCGAAMDFESGIPGDWTVSDDSPGGDGITWVTTADNECGIDNNTGASGTAACADSDFPGSANSPAYDTSLITPPIDLSGVGSATLDASTYFRYYDDSQLNIEIWNGSDWDVAWTVDSDSQNDVNVDLDAYTGADNVQVRFRYLGDGWDYYAQVDDVALSCSGSVSHEVTAAVGGGQGGITPASQSVEQGGVAEFTVTPDAGWSVESVTGDTCTPVDAGGGSWTAEDIDEACSVTAVFQINQYSVTPSAGSGGGIAPSSPQTVEHGERLQFSITPDPGYAIESVGGSCGGTLSDGEFTTEAVEGDCSVDAAFEVIIDELFDDAFQAQ